jgi:hypothetical protein
MSNRLGPMVLFCAALLGGGCSGGNHPGGRAPGSAGDDTPPAGSPADQPGPAVFRRLTRVEYNNTVRDLLADASAPANRMASLGEVLP